MHVSKILIFFCHNPNCTFITGKSCDIIYKKVTYFYTGPLEVNSDPLIGGATRGGSCAVELETVENVEVLSSGLSCELVIEASRSDL